ncbi:MAG: nucleotide pyrophosphohydrolase, partial [Proteobacteria bacterium]|nr:nucleotide pyrophosphohydrolase [Pseudomonadota bacterium]
LDEISAAVAAFRDARQWRQFHTGKSMALSLLIESGEVAELFQWGADTPISSLTSEQHAKLADELSDVLYWVLAMAADAGVDLSTAFTNKMAKNEAKYPVDKARGSCRKYTELE